MSNTEARTLCIGSPVYYLKGKDSLPGIVCLSSRHGAYMRFSAHSADVRRVYVNYDGLDGRDHFAWISPKNLEWQRP